MKGLLVKDLRLMKANRNSLIMVLAICVIYGLVYGATQEGVSMIVFLISFIVSNLAVGTITIDSSDNGMEYLMSFPNTKRYYVFEKYLFVALIVVLSTVVDVITSAIILMDGGSFGLNISLVVLMGVLIYDAISMPIFIKHGAEKGRVYVFMIAAIIAVIGYGLISFADNIYVKKIMNVVSRFSNMDKNIIMLVGIIAVVCVYLLSMFISIRVVKKKSF